MSLYGSAQNNWVFQGQNSVDDIFATIDNPNRVRFIALQKAFEGVTVLSNPAIDAYNEYVLGRFLRRDKVLANFTHLVVLLNSLDRAIGLPAADLAALKAYDDAVSSGKGEPGSKKDAAFATLEDAAMRAFLSVNIVTATNAAAIATTQTDLKAQFPAIGLKDSQWQTLAKVLRTDVAEESKTLRLDELDKSAISLLQQEKGITDRIKDWLKLQLGDEAAFLKGVIEGTIGVNPENLLSPINTGYLFFTEVYTAALQYAYMFVEDFMPCLARAYSSDDLIESETYQSRYAFLVNGMLRLIDAKNPRTFRYDKNELRAKFELINPLNSLRGAAARDPAIRHACACDGALRNGAVGGAPLAFAYQTPYPLSPSVQVTRGAF